MAIRITSPDYDHRNWDELLRNKTLCGVYLDAFAAPHHGDEGEAKGWKRLVGIGGSGQVYKIHGDLKPPIVLLRRLVQADHPPRTAQFVLLLIPKKNREHLVGDLEEEYRTKVLPEWGRFRAQFLYWEQTAIAVICYLWPVLKRILGLAAIWKVIGR
jgi:hypothetical protein